jgi:nucleoid DNA-binding protein
LGIIEVKDRPARMGRNPATDADRRQQERWRSGG